MEVDAPRSGSVKKALKKAARAKAKSNGSNGVHAGKPKLRPIEELIRKICRNDHTEGIIAK